MNLENQTWFTSVRDTKKEWTQRSYVVLLSWYYTASSSNCFSKRFIRLIIWYKSINVKVDGAGDAVKENPPRRPILVAVREKRSLFSIPLPQKQFGLSHRKLCRQRYLHRPLKALRVLKLQRHTKLHWSLRWSHNPNKARSPTWKLLF